jgi:hypothetical protein
VQGDRYSKWPSVTSPPPSAGLPCIGGTEAAAAR